MNIPALYDPGSFVSLIVLLSVLIRVEVRFLCARNRGIYTYSLMAIIKRYPGGLGLLLSPTGHESVRCWRL